LVPEFPRWKTQGARSKKRRRLYQRCDIQWCSILKVQEIIFLRAKYIMGHFKGFFEGAKTFLTP
jgi:hypothetical protein